MGTEFQYHKIKIILQMEIQNVDVFNTAELYT